MSQVLECVVNVSEGRRPEVVAAIAAAAGQALLDVHSDAHHHRSVLSMAGEAVEDAARAVAGETLRLVDLSSHGGAHPRMGALDVVPYVDLDAHYYKLVGDFDKRFPEGAPSMRKAQSLRVSGDWTFGHGVQVVGDVDLGATSAQRVPADSVLSTDSDA